MKGQVIDLENEYSIKVIPGKDEDEIIKLEYRDPKGKTLFAMDANISTLREAIFTLSNKKVDLTFDQISDLLSETRNEISEFGDIVGKKPENGYKSSTKLDHDELLHEDNTMTELKTVGGIYPQTKTNEVPEETQKSYFPQQTLRQRVDSTKTKISVIGQLLANSK